MAGPNLPENVVDSDPGHLGHHNAVHDVVNKFEKDLTPGVGDVPTWNGTLYTPQAPPGASGATGFSAAFGHRYVDYVNGLDANNGVSPGSAKKTLQAAHDSLPSNGGIVWAAPGQHVISSQVNWTRNHSVLIGAGRNATEFLITANNIHGIRMSGDWCFMSDFRIGDRSDSGSAVNALSGIYAVDAEHFDFRRIRFNELGRGRASGLDWDNGPAGLRIEGVSQFGDWSLVDHCDFRSCYRGIAIASGMNGWVKNCPIYGGVMESVYVLRRSVAIGSSCAWRFEQCQWVGGPGSGYQVRLDWVPGVVNQIGNVEFLACVTELSAAGGGFGSYYINLDNVILDACRFSVSAATGPTIRCGPDASNIIVGPYIGDGGPVFQVTSGNTGAMKLWQQSDFTGTPTTV